MSAQATRSPCVLMNLATFCQSVAQAVQVGETNLSNSRKSTQVRLAKAASFLVRIYRSVYKVPEGLDG